VWGANGAPGPDGERRRYAPRESNVFTGPSGGADAWVRGGQHSARRRRHTTVVAQVSFANNLSELSLWVPSYAGSGVGLTIELFDGGPSGTLIATCRMPMIDRSLLAGYLFDNRPTTVFHSCGAHHASSSFFTSKVHLDAYGTNFAPLAGFARALGDARVQSIRYVTCLD